MKREGLILALILSSSSVLIDGTWKYVEKLPGIILPCCWKQLQKARLPGQPKIAQVHAPDPATFGSIAGALYPFVAGCFVLS